MALGTIALAPLGEELIFRELVFHGLFRRSRVAAYCLSAALFSLIHMLNYLGSFSPEQLALARNTITVALEEL